MCITGVIQKRLTNAPLILCHNRDEFHARKCQPLTKLENGIYAGIDGTHGGYWLSLTTLVKNPYAVVVLNYRNMSLKRSDNKSRGILVKELSGLKSIEDAITKYRSIYKDYNKHSILILSKSKTFSFSSHDNCESSLDKDIHSFSNGLIEETWPKQDRLRSLIQKTLPDSVQIDSNKLTNDLIEVLKDSKKAAKEDLPDTFVGEPMEEFLSSIFIQSSSYGTRSSTVIVWEQDSITISDINYSDDGSVTSSYSDEISTKG
jgi:uncharacterized protein with NRDE domain